MSSRARPEGCCPFEPVRPLARRERDKLVGALRALGDPTRLEILRLLGAQAGPTCVCDLVDHFELSQPTISHHLRTLREAGLVSATRTGIWSFYALEPEARELLDVFGAPAQSSRQSASRSRARAAR